MKNIYLELFKIANRKIRLLVLTNLLLLVLVNLSAQTIKVINAGGGGDYTSLNAAITGVNAIATPTAVELQIASDLTETVASTINNNANLTSLKIYPTGAARTISVSTALNVLTIKADNVTVDGTIGGTGTGVASLYFTCSAAASNTNTAIYIGSGNQGTYNTAGTICGTITVNKCNFSNFDYGGCAISNNVGTVTIANNSFYNTRAASLNGGHQMGIKSVNITTANALVNNTGTWTITGNYIGGNAPLAAGTWLRGASGSGSYFTGIWFSMTASATPATVNISGNVIQNIEGTIPSTTTYSRQIRGIVVDGTQSYTIDGNTVANLTLDNDASVTVTMNERSLYGILISNNGTATVTNNTIYNFVNNSLINANGAYTSGIIYSAPPNTSPTTANGGGAGTGTYLIQNNVIHNLSSTIPLISGTAGKIPTGTNLTCGIMGFTAAAKLAISSNTIYTINNTNSTTTNSAAVAGIYVKTASNTDLTVSSINNNKVYDIWSASTAASASAPYVIGIAVYSGNLTCYDNAVSMGVNAQGGTVVGILKNTDATASNSNFYYNNVYIDGVVTTASSERSSFAFLRLGTVNPTTSDIVKNNIFYNVRSGSLSHYAIGLTSSVSNFTSDYNELYSGTSTNLGTVTATDANSTPTSLDFSTWKTTISGDAASQNITLTFTNTASGDLHTTAATLKGAGVTITGITSDLDNATRLNPPSIGAYEQLSVTGITVAGASGDTTITTSGGTLQMNATITPVNAAITGVTWSVANGTGAATINSTGLLTALLNGTVTVRATATDGSNVYGEQVVTISGQPTPVTGITVSGAGGATTITTNGGTLQMNASVTPVDAVNKSVTWNVTNGSGTATINSTGLLTALTNGTVTVRATAVDGSNVYGEQIITISGQPVAVTGITVTGTGGMTTITTSGGTLQMNASVMPVDAVNKSVTWNVTNGTGSATINSTGLLTALTNGTVTVRATATDGSGVYGELTITISGQPVLITGITVTGGGGATTITTSGGLLQMSAKITPTNATSTSVIWTVTNGTGQATINNAGWLSAMKNGTVTVRATAADGSSVYGETIITISGQTTAVNSLTDQKIIIYPNPAENVIMIDNASEVKQYAIISLDGRILLRGENSNKNIEITVTSLIQGVYILKLYNSGSTEEFKIFKK